MKRKSVCQMILITACAVMFAGCGGVDDGENGNLNESNESDNGAKRVLQLTETAPMSDTRKATYGGKEYVLTLKSSKGSNFSNGQKVVYTASVTVDGVAATEGTVSFYILDNDVLFTNTDIIYVHEAQVVNGKAAYSVTLDSYNMTGKETANIRVRAFYNPTKGERIDNIYAVFNQSVGVGNPGMKVTMAPGAVHGGDIARFTVEFNVPVTEPVPSGKLQIRQEGAVNTETSVPISDGKAAFQITCPKAGMSGAITVYISYKDERYAAEEVFMIVPEYRAGETIAPEDIASDKPAASSRSASGYTLTLTSNEGTAIIPGQPVLYTVTVMKDDGSEVDSAVNLHIAPSFGSTAGLGYLYDVDHSLKNGRASFIMSARDQIWYGLEDITVEATISLPGNTELSTKLKQVVGVGKPAMIITQNPEVICVGDTVIFTVKMQTPPNAPVTAKPLKVTFTENNKDSTVTVPFVNGEATFEKKFGDEPVEIQLQYEDPSYKSDLAFTTVPSQYRFGDVNNDHSVDSIDLAFLKKYLLGESVLMPHPAYKIVADVNGDGAIDSIDLALVKAYLLGKITRFPADM